MTDKRQSPTHLFKKEGEITENRYGTKRKRYPVGLRAKIMLLLSIPVVIILGALIFISLNTSILLTQKNYRAHAESMIYTLQASINEEGDLDAGRLQRLIGKLKKTNSYVKKISFYRPSSGKVFRIASSDQNQIGKEASKWDKQPILNGKTIFAEENGLMEIIAPIKLDQKIVASVGIYMTTAPRNQVIRSLKFKFAGISLGGFILLLLLLYSVLNRLLLQPIDTLKKAAEGVERGHLGSFNLKRTDEIGLLARRFNEMIIALKRRERENAILHRKLKQNLKKAKAQALTDGLTGLYNHRFFQERLEEEIARAQRSKIFLSVAFCDLDFFKLFNDVNGHLKGDEALKDVAKIIRKCLREGDFAARYGGEEFALILPNADQKGARAVAKRIRDGIKSLFTQSPLTISIGIATFPVDAIDKRELLHKADWAMYFAKEKGKDQVRSAEEVPFKKEKVNAPSRFSLFNHKSSGT